MLEVRPEIEYASRSSKFFGNDFQGLTLSCATWPWKAKEIYEGEFGGKTPKGVLFIGNTYDVATSMIAAHAMGDLFEGSAVLEQKGFGVCLSPCICLSPGTAANFIALFPAYLARSGVQVLGPGRCKVLSRRHVAGEGQDL